MHANIAITARARIILAVLTDFFILELYHRKNNLSIDIFVYKKIVDKSTIFLNSLI